MAMNNFRVSFLRFYVRWGWRMNLDRHKGEVVHFMS